MRERKRIQTRRERETVLLNFDDGGERERERKGMKSSLFCHK
jgi:hypothetical protein